MSAVAKLVSPKKYLELERKSEVRHEYIDGRMIEMTGANENHDKITGNIIFVLKGHFRGGSGDAYSSDMRVRIPSTGRYTYPDVVVISDQSVIEEEELDVLLNPAVIFEVLSETTANYDREKNFNTTALSKRSKNI